MTSRLKHNKKRNTALLYEILVREIVKQTVDKDVQKRNKAISLLKEHFKKGTEIGKELQMFKNLLETQNLLPHTAEKLIQGTKKEYSTLNIKKIFSEQSALIKKINKELSSNAFSNFVPNYKDIATLSQIFGEDVNTKKRVILEESLLKRMTSAKKRPKEENTKLSALVMDKFVGKFNKKYGNTLLERQQALLGKYILSFLDSGADFKIYLNEEIGNLKKTIDEAFKLKEIVQDVGMSSRMKEVKNLLEASNQKPVDQELLQQILKIQALAKEIES